MRGGLRHGESVLIHAGSGGVGQAAIGIALALNCTVYTTVSSSQKRAVLQERFPQVGGRRSRLLLFDDLVRVIAYIVWSCIMTFL